jgi:2-octaprenyl-6-methoxyphenol hydroxylase
VDNATPHPEVLIIGAGIIGSLLSLALRDTPFQTLLCDASDFLSKTEPHFDARSIALNQASIHILSQLGLWDTLSAHATPIQTIQVSSQHQFGAAQLKLPQQAPLGAVVEMHRFYAALYPLLDRKQTLVNARLTHYCPETQTVTLLHKEKPLKLSPKLIIAADGTSSSLRPFVKLSPNIKDYQQQAIVANIELKRHHQNLAIERFTSDGPLALLPLEGNRMALVWCVSPERAQTLQQASELGFLQALQATIGYRLGRIVKVGQRSNYPLTQLIMAEPVAGAVVFVGNAAQTLHPVAGQGLNLGMRDIATLAQCLVTHGLSPETLLTYQALRATDRQTVTQVTDVLVQLFMHPSRPVRLLRSLALMAFGNTKSMQSTLIRYASGFGASPPDLACDIPLSATLDHPHPQPFSQREKGAKRRTS